MKGLRTSLALSLTLATVAVAQPGGRPAAPAPPPDPDEPGFLASGRLLHPRESHLAEVRQLTFGGENAEAYWSPDGAELIFQSTRPPHECDQIYRVALAGESSPRLVSTGTGRTTCAYFTADQKRILYASTHAAGPACPPVPDRAKGYVWPLYADYEIYTANPDGSDLRALTDNQAYDAEATVCPVDGSIVFTSTRDGDLELYRMDADGGNVKRLTETPGYDGGAFFSRDCTQIVWRASRPSPGAELEDYQSLLAQNLVRPSELEIWVARADGSEARQITYLGAASFAPYFFPAGDRVIFSSNYGGSPREFDLWAVDVDGTDLERISYAPGFDGFPMFSPDGRWLAFGSNRNQGKPGETDVYVARWVEHPPKTVANAADAYQADVTWLAADEREGRGVGTEGLAAAGAWLEARFAELGLEPAGEDGGFRHRFEVPVALAVAEPTFVEIAGERLAAEDFRPAGFSAASPEIAAPAVAVGYGVTAPEHGVDEYAGKDVRGKIAVVRRFTPEGGPFADDAVKRRYSDLRAKSFNAREHGAVAMLVVDLPEVAAGAELPEEALLPGLAVDAKGDAGIPVFHVKRAAGQRLFAGEALPVRLQASLSLTKAPAFNVVGRLPAGAPDKLPGALVIGAHYDHLGLGGHGSLAPDSREPHNGADDNASGTAALIAIGRELAKHRAELARDVYVIAFSGEETGILGSTALTRHAPAGLAPSELYAMLNLDMVGRLRGNRLSVLGGDSAGEWQELVPPACERATIACSLGGDGYGPSDQTPFYAAGVPVLHFFTGAHEDYHKPSDDSARVNAIGGARVASLVADLAAALARRHEPLTYKVVEAPPPQGDSRSFGAYFGTIPDYAGPEGGAKGVLLAGVREGSPAEKAGLRRGDLLVSLRGSEIGDVYDFVFVLRQAKPDETVTAIVVRDGQRLELKVTFTARR